MEQRMRSGGVWVGWGRKHEPVVRRSSGRSRKTVWTKWMQEDSWSKVRPAVDRSLAPRGRAVGDQPGAGEAITECARRILSLGSDPPPASGSPAARLAGPRRRDDLPASRRGARDRARRASGARRSEIRAAARDRWARPPSPCIDFKAAGPHRGRRCAATSARRSATPPAATVRGTTEVAGLYSAAAAANWERVSMYMGGPARTALDKLRAVRFAGRGRLSNLFGRGGGSSRASRPSASCWGTRTRTAVTNGCMHAQA